ncbi:MAG: rod shape-determining protein MreD [Deltaproteobacteria bacterium]|nr:rod shape-determining protein MreD [Deltaproteobacteria bacterium]MBW2052015.1 rod shape-determining protein MreD [Deltaproteobacteria bacterium]MBW2139955.1 rod shape-determining protein MreD [Deltaproteobacteria bacterium]MBW2322188.1 rod shape-determining protein MreD [Deltaproteobacteria bacterium]
METRFRAQSLSYKEAMTYLFLGIVFLILETTAWSWVDPAHCRPNLILILIVYLGMAIPLITGSILIVCFGLLTDTASGGPAGLFTIVYLLIFGITVLMRQRLEPTTIFYQMIVILLLAVLAETMIWCILSIYGWPLEIIFAPSRGLFIVAQGVSVLLTAFVSPVFFWFFERIRFTNGQQTGDEV